MPSDRHQSTTTSDPLTRGTATLEPADTADFSATIPHEREIAPRPMAKIIPLRKDIGDLMASVSTAGAADHGRHFLKVTLPAIPVAVFTLTFLLCYCLEATEATHAGRPINPAPALLGSLALTAVISALCISIYSGFRHVAGLTSDQG